MQIQQAQKMQEHMIDQRALQLNMQRQQEELFKSAQAQGVPLMTYGYAPTVAPQAQ